MKGKELSRHYERNEKRINKTIENYRKGKYEEERKQKK